MSSRLYHRLFAFGMHHGFGRYRRIAEPHVRELLAPAAGQVLEIGCGTGRNLAYLSANVNRWTGVDLNPYMLRYAAQEAIRWGKPAHLARMDAGRLAFASGSFDAVIATLLLCSVPEPARALAEMLRVLRPGGRYYFFEHVAAGAHTRLCRWQKRTAPLWRYVGDGCSPARHTLATIEQAGFARVEARMFSLPVPVFSPHIAGWAEKG